MHLSQINVLSFGYKRWLSWCGLNKKSYQSWLLKLASFDTLDYVKSSIKQKLSYIHARDWSVQKTFKNQIWIKYNLIGYWLWVADQTRAFDLGTGRKSTWYSIHVTPKPSHLSLWLTLPSNYRLNQRHLNFFTPESTASLEITVGVLVYKVHTSL